LGDDPVQLRVPRRERDELAHQQLRSGDFVHPTQTPRPFDHRLVQELEQRIDRRLPQRVLRPEVVAKERLGDARSGCDLACRSAVERPLGEEVGGGGLIERTD
jgi:hypothetical protein